MKNAKEIYVLSNGETVGCKDRVKVTREDGEVCTGVVIDIGKDFITVELDDDDLIDAFFSELKDVRLLKD